MNKKENVTKIIQTLLNTKQPNTYRKEEIEQAIRVAKWTVDQRTIENWFTLLWKLGFLHQDSPGVYGLNIERVAELEVQLPLDVDPKQRRLPVV